MISVHSLPGSLRARLHWLVLSPAARPLRFAGTGGTSAAVQLALLAVLTNRGWDTLLANASAFFLAAQVNFALSCNITWRDRLSDGARGRSLIRRWILFHGSIALMALANMVTFALARSILPALAASLAGIAAGALGNYLAADRFVFRDRAAGSPKIMETASAA